MKTTLTAVLVLIGSPALGASFDGNALNNLCRAQPMAALFYVFGAAEQMTNACIPAQVDAEQITDVVCHSLQSQPATRHEAASALTLHALTSAWPCQ